MLLCYLIFVIILLLFCGYKVKTFVFILQTFLLIKHLFIMNINKKIIEYLDYKGVSQRQFTSNCELSEGVLRRGNNIGSGYLKAIKTNYPDLSMDWLLFDEGEMIYSGVLEDEIQYNKLQKIGVPYYDVEFTAGFTFLEMSQTNTPSSYIAHPFFATSDFVVRNSGQSMAKVIKHGDAIGLKHLPQWNEFLAFGEIYAIVLTDDRRLVKIITKGDSEDTFTLISKPSDNKKDEFPPQQIKKSLIRNVFRVEAASCLF